jgi:hypothetical protein
MNEPAYDSAFYSAYANISMESAREVLAIVKDLAHPKSVVDVGCGIGTWLCVWQEFGVPTILGIDGSYVRRDELLIAPDQFVAMDLSMPTTLDAKFDLVQSLEVGEHLPEVAAQAFISFLCSLGPVVLFSAAIPYQGGTSHVNEQWPEYWAGLFAQNGYIPVDTIRDQVWENSKVAYYYAQNALIFVQADNSQVPDRLRSISLEKLQTPLARVHPKRWHEQHERYVPLKEAVRIMAKSSREFMLRSLKKTRRVITHCFEAPTLERQSGTVRVPVTKRVHHP